MLLTILIVLALILWLFFALRHLNRKDENGHRIHSCGHNCANCAGCQMQRFSHQ